VNSALQVVEEKENASCQTPPKVRAMVLWGIRPPDPPEMAEMAEMLKLRHFKLQGLST